ncbi:MAG TPA: CvpA family protein [Bryobacterales bacterium]|nr:CvpA family protein [Bryobacterales bacterium]
MNWLDVIIALVVLTSLVLSIIKGLTRELVSLAAAIVGLLAALWWYPDLSKHLEPYSKSETVSGFVSFLLIFMAFLILGFVLSKILASLVKATGMRWFDRILGAAFGLLRGVLIAAVLVLAIVAFAPGKRPIESVAESRLAPSVLQFARVLVALAPHKIKDGFEDGLNRIRKVWRQTPPTDKV